MSAAGIALFALQLTPPEVADEPWRRRLESEIYTVVRAAGLTEDPVVYAANYQRYFTALEAIDAELGKRRFLLGGENPSAADEWLAILLCLHDLVFYGLYKLNRQRLEDFSNLAHYTRDVFSDPDLRKAIDFKALQRRFYLESATINPQQRVPLGSINLNSPHDRTIRFGAKVNEAEIEEKQKKPGLNGEWVRKTSGHRHRIGGGINAKFPAASGRYHLYVANNCPWCHRAVLTRKLKRLDDVISMDVLYYRRDPDRGWQFRPEESGCTPDTLFGYRTIRELYERIGSRESSVPVLWDRETQTIVSNESSEIIRMFDQAFVKFSNGAPQLYPPSLRTQIDGINNITYHAINNGAYKAGFADSQAAYEKAYRKFFDALAILDYMLRGRRFLLGDTLTEADVRLFPTIFRFDPIYYTRFNLNQRMVRDIPSLKRWLDHMLAIPGIAEASNLEHCRRGYFGRTGNNIVPLGPRYRP